MSAFASGVARAPRGLWRTWLWKEWLSQRGMLLAYLALAFTCLACGLWITATSPGDIHRIPVPALFIGAGAVGVLVFAAPFTVRGEFTSKDDQFLRRLPGALPAATAAKLAFLGLAALALPLAGLLMGEVFLAARGVELVSLAELDPTARGVDWEGRRATFLLVLAGLGLAFTPWVVAVASWLPGGRMAIGGACGLAALMALGVSASLRSCPGLEQTLSPMLERWLAWLALAGLPVAIVSLVRGRRGGGAARSAKFGVLVAFAALVPPGAWLGSHIIAFRWPNPNRLAHMSIDGLTPDLRYAVGRGSEHVNWWGAPMRFDLLHGTAEQIASAGSVLTHEILAPFSPSFGASRRFWRIYDHDSTAREILDAQTGARYAAAANAPDFGVTPEVCTAIEADVRATSPFRAPGGRRVFVLGDTMHVETANGEVAYPWSRRRHQSWPAGHGAITRLADGSYELFDFTRGRVVAPSQITVGEAHCVNGLWIVRAKNGTAYCPLQIFDPDHDTLTPCDELQPCTLLCMWNDDEVVVLKRDPASATPIADRLFTFHVADRRMTPIALPGALGLRAWLSRGSAAAFGLRDHRNRLWLIARPTSRGATPHLIAVDPHTRQAVEIPTVGALNLHVLAFPDADTVLLLEDHARIVRLDYERGVRTVLVGRERPETR